MFGSQSSMVIQWSLVVLAALHTQTASAHAIGTGQEAQPFPRFQKRGVDPSFTAKLLKRDDDEDSEDSGSGDVIDEWLAQNEQWASEQSEEDLATWNEGQDPKVLWIGCSDSRVSPEIVLGLRLGDVFVHRNVGNIVHPYDDSFLGFLEYGIANLKIEHVIVAGHTKCGGVHSVMQGIEKTKMYALDGWLTQMDLLMQDNAEELEQLDEEEQWRRLSEMNASDSAKILNRTKIVRDARERGQIVNIYAMLYDIGEGKLIPLEEINQ